MTGINYFKVLIRRLRSALQRHSAIHFDPLPYEQDMYRIDARLEVIHDVLELRAHLSNADADSALSLYQGAFLPEADSRWASDLRHQLLDETLNTMLHAARTLEATRSQEANRLYETIIRLEPLSDTAHIGVIRTFVALGRVDAARSAFTRLERMLAQEFQTRPDEAVQRLVSALSPRSEVS